MELLSPTAGHLPSYFDAVRRNWDGQHPTPEAAAAAAAQLAGAPADLLTRLADDLVGVGQVVLPDGTTRARIPQIARWLWDGQFAGTISLRWQPGTSALPEHVLGHIGYHVVPWRRRRGYATAAIAGMLTAATELGLPHVTLDTGPANYASQRAIINNGGLLQARYTLPTCHGGGQALRWIINLSC